MKFYISSRVSEKQKTAELTKLLESKGHAVTLDWTQLGELKPYEVDQKRSARVAADMVKAVQGADVFVFFPDVGGTGTYAELGVALAEDKKIFVVGDFVKPIFLFHPLVTRVSSVQELEEKLEQ